MLKCVLLKIIVICLVIWGNAYAALPRTSNVPGGVVEVTLGSITIPKPQAFLHHKRVMIVPYHKKWTAVVGIPLTTKSGTIYLNVKTTDSMEKMPIKIKSKHYTNDFIVIKNKRLVTPAKKDLKRIRHQQKTINTALRHWSDQKNVHMDFIWPVTGRISSPFGLKRFDNGKYRGQHRGIDIAAATNTPVVAAADGTVVDTGHYFFVGNSVILAHGQGLLTVYCHLNRILVRAGQKVKQGKVVGLIGQTGRVTGPHLHWGVRLNKTPVNPALFIRGGKSEPWTIKMAK